MSELTPAVDPRIAPLVAEVKSLQRGSAIPGALMALLGVGAFFVLALAVRDGAGVGAMLCTGSIALGLFVPGVRLVLAALRSPLAAIEVKLLTTERGQLAAWDVEYVSINRGAVHPRLVLVDQKGAVRSVRIPSGHENSVREYVAAIAPQRVKNP